MKQTKAMTPVTVSRDKMDGKTIRSEVLRGDLISSSSPGKLPRSAFPLRLPPEKCHQLHTLDNRFL